VDKKFNQFDLKLLSSNKREFEQVFFDALENKHYSSQEICSHSRARYLCGYLQEIKAQTLIIEYEYIDGDYLEDFAAYYSRCFKPYQRACKRLHFFARSFDEECFLNSIRQLQQDSQSFSKSYLYLGFIVARPLPVSIIGRTVLKTYDTDNGRRNYTCVREYKVNLFGIDLEIKGLAFQEQDKALAACATVSLWSCFHQTSALFNLALPRPAVITHAANQVISRSRPIPSGGLNVEQMCSAIKYVGLEQEVFQVKPGVPLISLIYSYLHMGLPVILGTKFPNGGLHAMTITGYSLKKERHLDQEKLSSDGDSSKSRSLKMKGLRIDEFYAHDDQLGPFSQLKITKISNKYLFERSKDLSKTKQAQKEIQKLEPTVVIIPVYHKIRINFIDITIQLKRFDEVLLNVLNNDNNSYDLDPFEWDVFITTTNACKAEFKKLFSEQANNSFSVQKLENILVKQHPKYIWRATLSYENTRILDFLADATGTSRACPFYQMVWYDETLKNRFQAFIGENKERHETMNSLTSELRNFLLLSSPDVI
jgi:hypothetical protein